MRGGAGEEGRGSYTREEGGLNMSTHHIQLLQELSSDVDTAAL